MQHSTNQILYSYWNEVRGQRIAPKRFEIEPARISAILPETFILERVGPENYRFRLAGTRICEQFCYELRRTGFLDLWNGDDIAEISNQLAAISQHGGVGLLQFIAETHLGSGVNFEAILLPLLHTQGTITRYLGAMTAAEQPIWLGAERLVRLKLVNHEIVWPNGAPLPVPEIMQPKPVIVGDHTASRVVSINRRRFRVYEGGRSKTQRKDG